MESIREYWPWALLLLSLGIIGSQAIQAGHIDFGRDVQGFCRTLGEDWKGSRLKVRIHNQHWIWVSCSAPENT